MDTTVIHKEREAYFDDPRITFGVSSRFVVRLVAYTFYACAVVFVLTALMSDIPSLAWAGVFVSLIICDRFFHIGKAERNIHLLTKGAHVNVALYTDPNAFRVLVDAVQESRVVGGNFYLTLMKRLIRQRDVRRAFLKTDINMKEFEAKLSEYIERSVREDVPLSKKELVKRVQDVALLAFRCAERADVRSVGVPDIFSALGSISEKRLSQLFDIFELDGDELENISIIVRASRSGTILGFAPSTVGGFARHTRKIRHRIMNRAWTARPTPTLDAYGEDITDLARAGFAGFMIGHTDEYERTVEALSKPRNPNVLLVGDAGVGKHTLVSRLAFQIIKDRVPQPLFDRRIVSLSIGSLVSGVDAGKLAERLNRIIDEIVDAGNIILYIPDIHNLVRTSGGLQMSAADILLPAIKGTDFSVIGATYPNEFKHFIQSNSDFMAAFDVVHVQELSERDATRVLVYASIIIERKFGVVINFPAIRSSVSIAHKYFRNTLLPASAENLLKEAVLHAKEHRKYSVGEEDVIAVAEKKINVPLGKIGTDEAEALLHLEESIHESFINQNDAVSAVARALREYRSGLSRKGGPIATFLFVGPTGVGKTELSKILARIQFGSSDFMIRFDMSEYQDKQSVFRFIGSPDGALSGSLTDAIREKPYSLLLLDEFEKAHPDILNLFLQVFDDGRLTDNFGRTVDFKNTIIIATSNAHSEFIKAEIEAKKAVKDIAESLKKKLSDYFKPELINRFSDIIVFKSLSSEDTVAVARLLLKDISLSLQESHAVDLVFDESAIQRIAELGYDPVFGARPLRKVISEHVRSALAEKLLKQEIKRGDRVVISTRDGEFMVRDTTHEGQ